MRLAVCTIPWHILLVCSTCREHAGVVCMQAGEGLTALRFSDSGMQCAVGTHNGLVALYDLRSSRPSIVKDHNYGAPIKDIKFHTAGSMAGGHMHDIVVSCLGCCQPGAMLQSLLASLRMVQQQWSSINIDILSSHHAADVSLTRTSMCRWLRLEGDERRQAHCQHLGCQHRPERDKPAAAGARHQ